MIRLTHDTPIRVATEPANFRCGIDGFAARTRELLGHDPRDGTLYVYTNRARTMIRGLVYDGTGFWLMTKRLSTGRFAHWPRSDEAVAPATARALRALLDGGPWQPGGAAAAPSTCPTSAVPAPLSTPACTSPRPWPHAPSTPSSAP